MRRSKLNLSDPTFFFVLLGPTPISVAGFMSCSRRPSTTPHSKFSHRAPLSQCVCMLISNLPPSPLQVHRPPLAVLHWRSLVHRCRPRRLGVQSQAVPRHSHRVAPLPALQDFASTQQLHSEAHIYRRQFRKRHVFCSHSEPCAVLWLSWLPPRARRHRPPSLLYLPALPHS